MKARRSSTAAAAAIASAVSLLTLGPHAVPGASAVVTEQCRASALRVGATGAIEANGSGSTCIADSQGATAGPNGNATNSNGGIYLAIPDPTDSPPPPGTPKWIEVSAAYARTDPAPNNPTVTGRANYKAEAGVAQLSLRYQRNPISLGMVGEFDGLGYIYVDGATSNATATCTGTVATYTGESSVARVSFSKAGVDVHIPDVAGNHHADVPIPNVGVLHLNEQTIDTSTKTITQRAAFLDFTNPSIPDISVAESVSSVQGC